MPATLILRRARLDDEEEILRACRSASPEVPSFLHGYEPGMPFGRYLEILSERERGVNLPPNQVAETFLFGFDDRRVVGRVSIRHALTDHLRRVGGHIGYVVVPGLRRRGHATEMLRQAIGVARAELGLDRLLVTCDDDNIASIRTIEKNGGVLEDVVSEAGLGKPKRRYCIAIAPRPAR